jgi:hypothetical protein
VFVQFDVNWMHVAAKYALHQHIPSLAVLRDRADFVGSLLAAWTAFSFAHCASFSGLADAAVLRFAVGQH